MTVEFFIADVRKAIGDRGAAVSFFNDKREEKVFLALFEDVFGAGDQVLQRFFRQRRKAVGREEEVETVVNGHDFFCRFQPAFDGRRVVHEQKESRVQTVAADEDAVFANKIP